MLRQWWDTDYHPEGQDKLRNAADTVDIKRCVPFILLHGAVSPSSGWALAGSLWRPPSLST
nr:hypothetical protein [Verrucomicrobium spinosum]